MYHKIQISLFDYMIVPINIVIRIKDKKNIMDRIY